ncbi:hypothetical protein ABMC88_15205 [Sulfitobacter sp. HNIBRBA2951]|uniref:hypothetical protein n=1 Tax=Sulfitobacter aquimarinus TaxID=3158557 RepID=UPI0032DEBF62
MAQQNAPLGENASNPHRWEQSDEIQYCLRSLHNHAPWLRTVWIVTHGEAPDLSGLPQALAAKVRIVPHAQIFAGYETALPTFNSLSIESVMWRIDGLSERFLYFNDDVFLTAPLRVSDVFVGMHPVLRGQWRDCTALAGNAAARDDPALFAHFVQMNAAAICGFGPGRVFAAAHVVHPMRRSVMAALFDAHGDLFRRNVAHRFRDVSQFLPQGLHNHFCLSQDAAVIVQGKDHLHIKSGQGAGGLGCDVAALLSPDALTGMRFLCVNDLPQLEVLVPQARALILSAVGG